MAGSIVAAPIKSQHFLNWHIWGVTFTKKMSDQLTYSEYRYCNRIKCPSVPDDVTKIFHDVVVEFRDDVVRFYDVVKNFPFVVL